MSLVEVKVPDIGDFKGVDIIEVLVKPGDVRPGRSADRTGSDKASMEVPAPQAGTVKELKVKVGDKVSEGDVILMLEASADSATAAPPVKPAEPASPPPPAPAPVAGAFAGKADLDCEMLVLGAGPGLLGCVPVRRSGHENRAGGALPDPGRGLPQRRLHSLQSPAACGGGHGRGHALRRPGRDLRHTHRGSGRLRAHKGKVVGKLTGGLAGMAKARKVETVRGYGSFLDPHHLEVELTAGDGQDKSGEKIVRFEKCIIAAGSQAVHLPSSRTTRASSIPPARWNCASSRNGCWSSAAASSAWRWPRSIRRWARVSKSWKCSMR